ncbi:leucine dehydrogenase [Salibacteraceae bacterium]|jgi:leucine dehydrogenase|nr:leucine dehydrogenase [Salibacteraceae bacterium]
MKVESQTALPLSQMERMGHEQIVFCQDPYTGLKAIIGVHNTVLGPALGGTRMWSYADESAALTDVLRLSRGMTYKAAISGLNLGGGKAVIIGDARTLKSEALMRRFGAFVDSLDGKYITAEDVGMTTKDMEYIHMETDHVVGIPETLGGGGDPSPVTAYGVYMGMKASAKKAYGSDDLSNKKVLVQGAGNVGGYLVDYLREEGAKVMIADIFEDKLKAVTDNHPTVQVVDPNNIEDIDMDIYAPCALGATLNDNTIPKLKCQIVAGAANNQLAKEDVHGKMLMDRGIVYAPDFLINAGGLINCYSELEGYNRDRAMQQSQGIYDTTMTVLNTSSEKSMPSQLIATQMAEDRINKMAEIHRSL